MLMPRTSANVKISESFVRAVVLGRGSEIIALTLLFYGVLRADATLADPQNTELRTDRRPPIDGFDAKAGAGPHRAFDESLSFEPHDLDALRSFTQDYSAVHFPASGSFSDSEFRPLPKSYLSAQPQALETEFAPMRRSTSAWQQLSDCRARGGIRLLTLWQSTWSTLSLQAGRRGDASLQWTSRAFDLGGASRGLFDRLFSIHPSREEREPTIEPAPPVAHSAHQTEKSGEAAGIK
jgi:hypothetical protein